LLLTIVAVPLVLVLLLKMKGYAEHPKALNSTIILAIVLVVVIAPKILFNLGSYGLFADPDCTLYIKDSNLLSLTGHIPPPATNFAEDPYYSAYPAFTLIINAISQVLGVTSTMAMYIVNVIIQLMFWMGTWLLLTKILPQKGAISLSIIIAAFGNVYLYGYLGVPLPQTMGLSILLLMLLFALERATLGNTIVFILLSILGLVHVGVIPVLLAVLALEFGVQHFFRLGANRPLHSSANPFIPFVIYTSYLVFTPALRSFLGYFGDILHFFSVLPQATAVSPGISRSFAFLNATAPAFIIGTNLALLAWFIIRQRQKHSTICSLGAGVALAAILLIGVGTLKQRFDVMEGFGSISRYFALPGYALGAIGTLIVLNVAICPIILDEKQNRAVRAFLVLIIILIAVGGLLDPFAFRPLAWRLGILNTLT
jgi:hypothetical protein